MTAGTTPECIRVRDELEALIEDTLGDELRDHVAQCDFCRDLRHETRMATNVLTGAGGDYRHPDTFADRVMAAADAQLKAMEANPPSRGGSATVATASASKVVQTAPLFAAQKTAESAKSEQSRDTQSAMGAESQKLAAPHKQSEGAKVVPIRKSNSGALLALVGIASVAAAIPFALKTMRQSTSNNHNEVETPLAQNAGAWSGRVALISRASADRTGGVQVVARNGAAPVTAVDGTVLAAGAELLTDARTRVRLDLNDGTRLVLDRNTRVRFDSNSSRGVSLLSGAVVADVAHLDNAPSAKITMPTGAVTVLGTRLMLTASEDRSTVRVTRGNVRVEGQSGASVEVKTGMEGVLSRGSAPVVSPAINLASSVSWSELGSQAHPEPDAPVSGLGELRARRPGQTTEQDHAVSLVAHRVKVRIVGNLARTEIEEVFRNETNNELEGIYRFPLPPEAQIERLALDIDGRMEQGAFVDKQRAAAIWRGVIRNAVHPIQQRTETEDLVWVPGPWRDPALLEWQRGGRFELKIFPIPRHGQRRVAIAYTQTIAPSAGGLRRYVYPLAHDANGSTRVEQFDVDVQVQGYDPQAGVRARGYALADDTANPQPNRAHMTFSQGAFVPAGDLVLEYAIPGADAPSQSWAFKTEPAPVTTIAANVAANGVGQAAVPPTTAPPVDDASYVAIALRPQLPHWSDARPRDYAIVVDTSRSMVGERMTRAARLARTMVSEMDPRDRVTVLACDTECREIPAHLQYASAESVRGIEAFLQAETAAGATDLVAQVRAAVRAIPTVAGRDQRIVYLGDGAASAGYRRPDRIAQEVTDALSTSHATITTVAIGADADSTVLNAVARAGGGIASPYVPGETVSTAALSVLEATYGITLRDPSLVLPAGLTEVTPSKLPTIRAGAEVLIVARMRDPRVQGEAVLRGTVGGEPFETRIPIDVQASTDRGNAFVPRLFASARIAELEASDAIGARSEIVALSQRFRVASRYTSLLVLEGDQMYRAFGVSRNLAPEADWTGEVASVSTAIVPIGQTGAHATPTPGMATSTTSPVPVTGASPDPSRDTLAANLAVNSQPVAAVPPPPAEARTASAREASRAERAVQAMGAMNELEDLANAQTADEGTIGMGSLGTLGHAGGAGTGQGYGSGMGGLGLRGRGLGGGGAGELDRVSRSAASDDGDDVAAVTEAVAPNSNAGPSAQIMSDSSTRARRVTSSASGAAPSTVGGGDIFAGTGSAGGRVGNIATQSPQPATPALNQPMRRPPVTPVDPRQMSRPGQWMRRIWVRQASVTDAQSTDMSRVNQARTALAMTPDSRAKHRDFYKLLSQFGEFGEAEQVAQRWTSRDALDPDAIVRLAESAARRGDRAGSLRILGGVADVKSDDRALLQKLVAMFDRAQDPARACAMRISMAEVFFTDAQVLADAVRCERAQGHEAAATRWLSSITEPTLRTAVDAQLARTDAAANNGTVRGELTVSATWDAPADLDIAVVDPRGNRISWLWGRTRGLTVQNAQNTSRESIGLSSITATGDYVIEVSRAQRNGPAITGSVTIRAMGSSRTFRLNLASHEDTRRVGGVHVTRESQLVPMN